jgi:hypothetical protein
LNLSGGKTLTTTDLLQNNVFVLFGTVFKIQLSLDEKTIKMFLYILNTSKVVIKFFLINPLDFFITSTA